jgi:hypothetical protein
VLLALAALLVLLALATLATLAMPLWHPQATALMISKHPLRRPLGRLMPKKLLRLSYSGLTKRLAIALISRST